MNISGENLGKIKPSSKSEGNTSFLRAARNGQLEKVLEHLKSNIDINTSNANGLNALHLASKDGHVEIVEELLKRGAVVDAATKKGNTALHIASLAGQEEVVKLLVQHGASVNVQSQNGFTPLYMAAQENHDNVVKYLLGHGANQSLSTEDGFTPLAVAMQQGHDKVVTVLLENDTRGKVRLPALHIAAKKDDVKAAKLLLENDHNPDVTSKSGFTPLHIASHYGNQSIANLLIQKGADVNYAAKHNITPLHVAAKWGKSNMVALLLDQGANIEAKTRDGLTPLHCAARSGHEQVVDMLLEKGAPISSKTKNGLAPLHMAAQGDHVDAARILLYHRAPVDEVTVDYLTALHVAAHCGHVRVAKLLLDRQADANARALNGFTPLHIACKKNRIKVVELLLKHGASIGATTESGLTPLHVASFMGCMNIVIYLLQHDASPDAPTVRGETPLHLAARANQTDIIRILLRNGAQVDARAREQQTPLHIASRLGNVDIVMLLLQHGAKVDNTTKDMYTALHIAAKEGQDEVAAVLIDNGASLNATTKKGFTPLHLASKYGHLKVAKLLLQKEAPVDAQGKNGVTPLHVASHYDHQNVALLLLNKGASPHAMAKNGHTPLHIAARKNQMDIADTLLEYGAQPNAESKAGFTPLHLSAQEGHSDISSLLIEHKANPNHQAKNGLTPLHLCAQEDRVPVAEILVKNGAEVNAATKAGYTPLHIASHYGQNNMVRFLLKNGANVKSTTSIGYTPLHQAAQQGHANIVNILLQNSAQPNAVTMNGQTPLHIAQKLGYITVIDTLKAVTEPSSTPTATEEKYRVVAPEAMHETFMSDSEEEGEDTVLGDQSYRYLTADEMKSLGDDSLPIDVTRDERIDSNRMVMSSDSNMYPPPHIEDTISPEHIQQNYMEYIKKYTPDNIDIDKHPLNIGFLVSFLVDARGGAMRGCRHSGVRVIVPPRCAASPTRVTCRYVRPQRTPHPPPLMEGEALASRILELGPVGAKFLGPVIIEVPHFAALRGKEREIVILRSDNGESWKEHTVDSSEDIMNEILQDTFEKEDLSQMEDVSSGRITRIVTQDFPQYFAVVSRVRQEVHAIGPEGGTVSSTVVPQVQATFPAGALTKKIKVGLQAQPIDPELVAKLLGHGVAVSPVVTIEPRRRKFHKAISLSMPAPRAHSQGMINQYSGSAPTLRLLCSITGGTSRAQWEDVTGSTPLSFVKDCVMFTTTVSARFWLMDCRNIGDATKMATELYREAIHVPFMAKFVVFAKRIDPLEARLRVFCMTDDKEDKTLEYQEQFTEVAKSRDVEVLEGKTQYIEFAGNLVPITKSGEQLQFAFRAFRENRLPFSVRVKDQHAEAVSRCLFMKEPKVQKGEPPQQPICILNIVLPDDIISETVSLTDSDSIKKYIFSTERFDYYRQDPRLTDISNLLGNDWVALANQLGLSTSEINVIKSEYPDSVAKQAQSMLRMWLSQSGNKTQTHILENGLKRIGREDIIKQCLEVEYKPHTYIRSRMDDIDKQDIEKDVIKHEKYIKEQVESKREIPDKYLAEEKEFEPSDEEDTFKKSVPERREQIEKRLSVERTIPASSQRVEIVQEISTIKRQSLVEDKIAEVQKATGEATKQPPKPVEKKETVQVKTTVKTAPAGKEPVVEERKVTKTIEKTVNERRDSDLLEGVTHILEATKKPIPVLIADEDPKSPKFSKTPPPSPADFISKEQAASVQQWDATAQSKLEPTEVKREEVVAQKEISCEPLTQASSQTVVPQPHPRVQKVADKVEKDRPKQVSPVRDDLLDKDEQESDTYSDKKKFWETITKQSDQKRMSLHEIKALENELSKKRASIHEISEPPQPKSRSDLTTSSESEDEKPPKLIETSGRMTSGLPFDEEDEVPRTEYQASFLPPQEQKPKQTIASDSRTTSKELEKEDSLDSDMDAVGYNSQTGYISDSGDVEHYISDSEIEDRVPQIRERQMSVFSPPVSTGKKSIYERSASLPTEDLYEVSARSIKLRKQYYEEQIKKEMIEEQLTSELEEETSPEKKSLPAFEEDEFESVPSLPEDKEPKKSVKDLAKKFDSLEDDASKAQSALKEASKTPTKEKEHLDKSEIEHSEKQGEHSPSKVGEEYIPEITVTLSGKQRRWSEESDETAKDEKPEISEISKEDHVKTQDKDVGIINKRTKFDEKSTVKEQEKFKKTKSKEEKTKDEKPQGKEQQLKDVKSAIKDERALSEDDKSIDKKIKDKKLKDEKSKDLKSKDQKPKEEKSKSQMVKDDKLKDEKTKAGKLKDQKTKDEELKDQKSKDRERDEPKDEKPKSKDVKLKSKELRSQVVEVKTKAKEEKSVTKDQKSHIKDAKVLTKGEDDKAKPQDQTVVAKDEKLENKMKDHVVDLNKFKKEHEKQVHETPKTNQDEEGVIKVSNIIDKKPIHSQKEPKAAESTKLMTNKLEEHENLKKVILAQPLCQPEEHDIQETVWEVSVQSEQRFDEKLMDIPTKEYVGLGVPQDPSTDKDDDLSSNARDESDLTSEIHQDHSDSLSDKIISDSHSDIEKIIMDSLHQQKVEPVEAKAIASALLEEIEEEIGKMDPLMSAVDETRTTFSESNKRQISEYLRKMAESKGLEDREIELVESVLARRQRELIKLARGDTQASSVEITDEDLRYSGGEADFPQLLEQQMDQLEAEKVDDIKAVYASIEEEQKQKDKSSTFDKIDEEQFTEKSSTQEYESYEKNGKTTHKKDTSITGYDRIKGEVFGSEKRNVILEEDESVLEVTSEEAAKVKGTSITDIQEDICSAGDKKLSQESHRSATKEHIEGESHRQSQIKDTYQNDREKQVSKIATTTEVRGGKQITTQDIKMDIEDTGLGIQQIATATLGKTQELCYEKQDEKSSATSEKMTLPDGRTLETMSEITEVSKTSKEETKDHVQELSQIVTLKEGDKTLPMKTKVDAMGRTSSSDSKSSVESSGRSAEDPFSSCSSGRKDEIGDGKIQTKVKLRKTKSEMDTSSSSSNLKPNRLSAIETEGHSSSGESYYHSFDSGRSRPCSSDVEGFFAGGSSEYESALTSQDTSIKSHITSGEYHTAISSLSSKESMKSLDSESSGNLASVEISEVSETIVPSSSDLEGDILDVQEHLLEELEQQPIVTEPPEFESKDSLEEIEEGQIFDVHSKMKRSCEMTFQPEPKVLLAESPQGESEEKFGTSLDEGSVLSISLSSTSSVQLPTVIELSRSDTPPGVSQKMYSSYEEVPSLSTSQADISTSTLLQHTDSPVDSVTIMTSKVEENGIYSVSTQVSSETRTDEPKKKGHRRQESSTIHFTKIETHKPQSDLTESDEYSGLGLKDDRKEDEQYQTEADQGFQKDMREGRYTVTHETHQRKKSHSEVSDSSEKSDKSSFEEAEAEAAFNMVAHVSPVHKVKQIIPILEDEAAEKDELETVERIKREKEKELELLRQKIRDQSPGSIPDIKVTEHMTPESASKTSSLDMDDQEKDAQKSTPETPASNSSKSSEETDQGREYILDDTTPSIREEAEETSESRIMTESRSEMGSTIIEKTTREETDSPNSDSFEMLEKPDLIDDFVVIEEVAKEAHECDAEGKSVKIQQKTTKRTIRKRTEDDEEPCVRSAPTPLTRMTDIKLYPDGSDELGFDFEESPPQPEENGRNRDYVREYNNELEANRQWIEQQFQGSQAATMAAGFGYEMEFERGPLEDIKEEDITDFDPSSRIGSLGSQKESGGSLGSVKDSYSSTPEYDVLAGKKYFTRSGENDDVSMSSLQEFENLERAMSLETKKFHQGSHSSSSNGSLKTKYGKSQGDDISVSSLKEFEGLEIACIAAHKIELKVKEEEALLSQIDEGQESIASESESCETVSVPEKRPPESDEEDYEKRMFEIDEIIKQAQTNVERFVDIKECEKTESLGRGDSVEEVSKVPDLDLDAPVVRSTIKVQFKESDDPMILSTDSLDCKVEESSRRGSTDSLDEKVPPADLMTTSTDSIEACSKRASEQITSDSLGRMVFSDSLELAAAANAAAAVLSDSIDEDGSRIGQDFSSSSTGRDFSSSVREDDPEQAGIPMEYMLGSTDSLEPTSSTATHATYQFESDSVFSGSFTSGGSNTMVSSTDTIDPMHVRETVDIAAAVKKVWFDENTDKEFTTEYLDYGSRPYVTEVIEPCDDGEYSHTIRRRVEMPPEIRKVTFQGPDAEEQLRRYMEEFGEGEFCQETEEVDADGNVHVKRVVQKRVIIKGGGAKPESLDEFQTEPGISKGSKDQPQLTKLTSDTGAVPKESSGFHHGRPEDQPGADSLHESTSEVDQKSPKPEPEKRDQ